MSRIITAISFDLRFDILSVPPTVVTTFTDVVNGREEHATASFRDAEAKQIWDAIAAGDPMIETVVAALESAALTVQEPGSVAARIAAASEAEQRARVAREDCEQLRAEAGRISEEIAAKKSELARLGGGKEEKAHDESPV